MREPTVPQPWKAVFDTSSGKYYFWNTNTNETTWTEPIALSSHLSSAPSEDITRQWFDVATSGDLERIKALLDQYSSLLNFQDTSASGQGRSALMYSSREGHVQIVQFLLSQSGIQVNAQNVNGWTALHIASSYGYDDIVHMLVNEGKADKSVKAKNGKTAAEMAKNDAIKKLLQ